MADHHENLLGQSNNFLEVLEQVSRLARLNKPVLVIGERGTGKELIARRLHYLSPRWQGPFISLNCAALNENLLDSELFGHEAGAFTGAQNVIRAGSSGRTAAPCFLMNWPPRR
jgi:psp operon transcriptional activator